MKCNGIVIYKNIEKRDGGKFKNDKGQIIDYNDSYIIKFDEIKDGKINERKLKFPFSNKSLYEKFKNIDSYTKIDLTCDVEIMNNGSRLIPIDVDINIDK